MQKHVALAIVKEDLERLPEVAHACVAIIEHFSCTPKAALSRITFGGLSVAAGCKEVSDVIPAVQYLSGARVRLLAPTYYFADPQGDEISIPTDTIVSAQKTGQFFHPDTGQPIAEFEQFIFVDFVLATQGGDVVAEWAGESA